MDGNFAWLRQKTEDPKSNKERKLTLPTHRVNVTELNCKVVRKVITPHFYTNPPFQVYPLFLVKTFLPFSF